MATELKNNLIPHTNRNDLFDAYRHDFDDRLERISYPLFEVDETITDRFKKLREDGGETITLVGGGYDITHPSHEWYRSHCRLVGALGHLAKKGVDLEDLCIGTDRRVAEALESPAVKLAVTVDADERISGEKSGKTEKGGVKRPIYPWEYRARRVANQMFRTASGSYRPVVDLVTVVGDSVHEGTVLDTTVDLAYHLKEQDLLDHFVVYGEAENTVSRAEALGLDPVVIFLAYEMNPQTGKPWSSSALVRRAQGEEVENPVTRPDTYVY